MEVAQAREVINNDEILIIDRTSKASEFLVITGKICFRLAGCMYVPMYVSMKVC